MSCNHCVKNFDHHCTFINQCVAKRNILNFVLFLNSTSLACALYIYSYHTIIFKSLIESLEVPPSADDIWFIRIHSFILIPVLIACVTAPPACVIGVPYAIKILQVFNTTFYNVAFSLQCWPLIATFVCAGVFSMVISTSFIYFNLAYMGYTRKEKKVVMEESNRKLKCVSPHIGIRNFIKFYLTIDCTESEL